MKVNLIINNILLSCIIPKYPNIQMQILKSIVLKIVYLLRMFILSNLFYLFISIHIYSITKFISYITRSINVFYCFNITPFILSLDNKMQYSIIYCNRYINSDK